MKKGLLLTTLVTIALAFFSCSNDDFDFVDNTATGDGIEFRTLMDKPSNGLRATITDEDNILSFTVTGIKMKDGSPVAESPYLFNGFGITRGEDSNWDYTPKRYWPKGLKLDFYAYSPSSSRNVSVGITDYAEGKSITYTVPQIDKKNNQEDFLLAKTLKADGYTNNTPVKLNFHHALSRATFYAKTTNADVTYVVESVRLLNLNETANLKLSDANLPATGGLDYLTKSPLVQWEKHSSMVNYTADMSEAPTYLGSEFKSMIGATNAILVMPQTTKLSTEGTGKVGPKTGEFAIEVSYKAFIGDIYYAGSPSTSEVKYFAVTDPKKTSDPITFEMGRQYNFYLTFGDEVGGAIGFSVGVSDWTDNAPTYVPELTNYRGLISNFLGTAGVLLDVNDGNLSGGTGTSVFGEVITKADLAKVAKLVVNGTQVTDFTGLEYFENLEEISLTDVKNGADLDASKNAKLTTVNLYNTIILGTVNLSNTALTKLYKNQDNYANIQNLDLSNTRIKQVGNEKDKIYLGGDINVTDTLNLSNCGLTVIDRMPTTAATFPEVLNLSNNALTSLDFSAATTADKPKDLNLSNNRLTEVKLPKRAYGDVNLSNNNFKTLEIEVPTFSNLDVSNNAALTALTTIETVVTGKLNASGNTALMNINLGKDNAGGSTKYLTGTLDISDSKGLNEMHLMEGYDITTLIVWNSCTQADYNSIVSFANASGNKATITNVKTKNGTVLVPVTP